MTRLLFALLLTAGLGLSAAPAPAQSAPNEFDCEVDEQQKRIRYSLYFENFRAEAYQEALPDLEWIIACAPGFGGPEPDERNVRRAVELHDALADQAEDAETRRHHLERALEILDEGPSILEDDGVNVDAYRWNIQKGRFLQARAEDFPDRQGEVCTLYEEAFTMQPDDTADYYIQVIAFCRTEAALADNSAEAKRDTREYLQQTLLPQVDSEATQGYITTQADRLITTPREHFAFLYERYQRDGAQELESDDLEQLFTLVSQAGADLVGSEEDARALRRELLPLVAELNPSYTRMSSLGNAALTDGDREQAIRFFQQALELAETNEQRTNTYYNIAAVRQQQGQSATAANNLREALSLTSNHGPSLFMMGSLIQGSIRGNDLQSRAAYWCAADYFNRAASAGVSGAGTAAARANSAAPSSDEYFFQGWRPGQTVSASYGWGSCQARVR